MDVEYPCNLDQNDIVDVPELIPKPPDVATETRMCLFMYERISLDAPLQCSISSMRNTGD